MTDILLVKLLKSNKMRKIIVFFAFALLSLTSCTKVLGDTCDVDLEIFEFEHRGHRYLIFTEYCKTISVIHDPDCECVYDN